MPGMTKVPAPFIDSGGRRQTNHRYTPVWIGGRKAGSVHRLTRQLAEIIGKLYPRYDPVLAMIHLAHGRGPDGETLMEYGPVGPDGVAPLREVVVPVDLAFACHREVAQYVRAKRAVSDMDSAPAPDDGPPILDLTRLTDAQLDSLELVAVAAERGVQERGQEPVADQG